MTAKQGVIVDIEFIDREITLITCQSEFKFLKDFKWGQYPEFPGEFLKIC